MEKMPSIFAWWFSLIGFTDEIKETWGKTGKEVKKEKKNKKDKSDKKDKKEKSDKKKEENEEFDLFGDDDNEEESKKLDEDLKKQLEKKKVKKVAVSKSSVTLEFKGYDDSTDFKKIIAWIKENVQQEGLVWGDKQQIVPHVFGSFKLIWNIIIEDEKISTEDSNNIRK